MSLKIRKSQYPGEGPLFDAINALLDAKLTTEKHRDKTSYPSGTAVDPVSTVATIAGLTTDQNTCNSLANEIKAWFSLHCADTSAHLTADAVNIGFDGYVLATSLATSIALANAIKVNYNVHRASTAFHVNADSTNTVTAADADDLTKLKTLLTDIKAKLNLHMHDAPATFRLVRVAD